MAEVTKRRYAVVTGGNKGIGLEVCKQLISQGGITVVLTARDQNKGLEALQTFASSNDGTTVVFHQLDVTDSACIASLAQYIKSQFGKLDILVNNAGILGSVLPHEARKDWVGKGSLEWIELLGQSYELASECVGTNYYGAKRLTEALLPLLRLSPSPRIVNVSSLLGELKNIPSEWAKGILNDVENLTEGRIDEVLNELLEDLKEGSLEAKGWPLQASAYIVSKAALNAYTRLLAKQYPSFRVNCVCPGYVKTDINYNTGVLTAEEGAESLVRLALLPDDGPSGIYFSRKEPTSFEG